MSINVNYNIENAKNLAIPSPLLTFSQLWSEDAKFFALDSSHRQIKDYGGSLLSELGKAIFEALTVAFSLLLGKEIGFEHPYGWLSVFEEDDLQDFIKELSEAFRLIDSSITAWEIIDALIHEWHESAVAAASPELADAFSAETDEVALKLPSTQSAV